MSAPWWVGDVNRRGPVVATYAFTAGFEGVARGERATGKP
jgi:hypothetical protein